MTEEEEALRAITFATESLKLGIERLQARIERLEDAFLKAHPAAVLHEIPYTNAEKEFFEQYADLIGAE